MLVKINVNLYSALVTKIAQDIKLSLFAHGHKFEGELENSIKPVLVLENGGVTLTADARDYILDLENGVPGYAFDDSKIDINKLERWLKYKKALGHAVPTSYMLIKKWNKEGFQAAGSLAYIQPGTKSNTGSIEFAIEAYEEDYYDSIQNTTNNILDQQFDQIEFKKI